ncbi:CLUMA_CG004343, isoform A [Clunio marinus]|uniref:CLUMA_CG004343, isoform A n=1 Tax=Clunio marinus TaxID=568069 RepID=A0A1J1HRD5_9DIPT|nr:CLUMA_CG004343, isoform A [Clunio marinus]
MVTMDISKSNSKERLSLYNHLMKKMKFMEEDRIASFKNWQYSESDKCSVQKMAEAGFFYTGHGEDDDSATCFVCGKVLDGWESNDDPWEEHEKHAPNCRFVNTHLIQDDYSVEQLFNLAEVVVKAHLTKSFNKKLVSINNTADEVRDIIKNQSSY